MSVFNAVEIEGVVKGGTRIERKRKLKCEKEWQYRMAEHKK